MECKIKVETNSRGYFIYVVYISSGEVIHADLIRMYDTYPSTDYVLGDVVECIFKYKSLGINVEIDKTRDINNMYDLDKLLDRLRL